MSGLELKIERVRAGIKACDVARECGVSRARLNQIEGQDRVSAEWEKRYREGMLKIIDESEEEK